MNTLRDILIFFLLIFGFLFLPKSSIAQERFFQIQSVDTMKISRDSARDEKTTTQIPTFVEKAALLNPTHIAVATPYDEEFYPVLKKWADEVHKRGINVWFRGNFSSWEGWFNYKEFLDPTEHIAKTNNFIYSHPELFRDGDIFTPVPEPENGGFGDPRNGNDIKNKLFAFLPKSYAGCKNAFLQIEKDVSCGYYSVNGDVAKLFTKELVQQTGGLLVIDHYVKTPEQLMHDAQQLHTQVEAPIVLGEYGAPIPDIHGDLTETQQSDLIRKNLILLAQNASFIKGINYWTAFGGSTSLFSDDMQPKAAAFTIKEYFLPIAITGNIMSDSNNPVANATIYIDNLTHTKSDGQGIYRILTTKDFKTIHVKKDGFFSESFTIPEYIPTNTYNKNVTLTATNKSIFDLIKIFLRKIGLNL